MLVVCFTKSSADATAAAEYHFASEMAPRITDHRFQSLLELKKLSKMEHFEGEYGSFLGGVVGLRRGYMRGGSYQAGGGGGRVCPGDVKLVKLCF